MNDHRPSTHSRRRLLTTGLAAAGAATLPQLFAAPASAQSPVDMELALVAAMVDPPKAGQGTTLNAGPHVEVAETALNAKGHLSSAYVDGHYGTATVAAYAAWQRALGYSGIDANGVPGPTSLTTLGQEEGFTVDRVVYIGSRNDSYGGERVNTRTGNMLAAADAEVPWNLTLSQGSYNPGGDPTSAGTHDGGGVVDISVSGLNTTQRWRTVQALREVGFAAWLRTPSQGNWPYHIHAVAVADTDMSGPAQPQVHDYFFGRNGLANHAPDNTPPEYRVGFTWWERHDRMRPGTR
ncbi:peptidoglycan-binding protein [Glycomyces xiaoerkulensis]|uniref:peptidoglycan-binding protein n=1 Tax=Glycomyces xiaoerkulensis TaxID=2038139 RepID=UPI000C25D335|nr:peptidoglycan-binding protein [Glycomyces xiaoerkulensis]